MLFRDCDISLAHTYGLHQTFLWFVQIRYSAQLLILWGRCFFHTYTTFSNIFPAFSSVVSFHMQLAFPAVSMESSCTHLLLASCQCKRKKRLCVRGFNYLKIIIWPATQIKRTPYRCIQCLHTTLIHRAKHGIQCRFVKIQ